MPAQTPLWEYIEALAGGGHGQASGDPDLENPANTKEQGERGAQEQHCGKSAVRSFPALSLIDGRDQ
jgi:hypothetical protein